MEGVTVYDHVPECHVTFGRGDFIMFDEISISTIELPDGRFQTFPDISLLEKLTWKSRCSQNKTFIRGASIGIPYELWDKPTIGWWWWNIATQEKKEVEIVTFLIKGSAQLTVPPDLQGKIQVGSRGVALSRVFLLKLSGEFHCSFNWKAFNTILHVQPDT